MARQKPNGSVWRLELMWWMITILILASVLIPIYLNIGNFPFYLLNVVVIISFITLARYLFLLPYTFLARKERLKIVIIILCIPLVFYLIQELNYFQTYIDEQGAENLVGKRPEGEQMQWANFVQNEILLFGVGAVITTIILPFRLILSIWRGRNRDTV